MADGQADVPDLALGVGVRGAERAGDVPRGQAGAVQGVRREQDAADGADQVHGGQADQRNADRGGGELRDDRLDQGEDRDRRDAQGRGRVQSRRLRLDGLGLKSRFLLLREKKCITETNHIYDLFLL